MTWRIPAQDRSSRSESAWHAGGRRVAREREPGWSDYDVFTEEVSMSPSASLKVKVTVPPATPCAPLMLHVTVVPTLTMMFSGQVTVVLGIPCAASDFSIAASAVEPGTWTDPGVSSYEYFPAPFCVTVAFP